jgi:hypothetical protein
VGQHSPARRGGSSGTGQASASRAADAGVALVEAGRTEDTQALHFGADALVRRACPPRATRPLPALPSAAAEATAHLLRRLCLGLPLRQLHLPRLFPARSQTLGGTVN